MPAQSKQQQKFMGIVRAIQKGDEPASKFSKDAQDAADDMKKKDVEKFASTKHKGLPKKVEQALREKIKSMVEDYVESCGYVVSAKDPNYKLKSPGGTGEEDRELKDEGFGGELPKTEKKKFEKERLENAEVLGYTLTGTKDLKETMNPRAVKKMRDEFEKTGQLPPHLKKFALDLKILKKKHKVKNIVVPGLEWMSDIKEVNEGKGVEKVLKMANDHSFGKLGGRTVDALSAGLFKGVYDKASDKNKEKINKMNEKQLYVFMTKLWSKFGNQVRIG